MAFDGAFLYNIAKEIKNLALGRRVDLKRLDRPRLAPDRRRAPTARRRARGWRAGPG